MIEAGDSLGFEPLLARIENDSVLHILAAGLAERLRARELVDLFLVDAWRWDFSLDVVFVEGFVIQEPGRGCIEAYLASESLLDVGRASLGGVPELIHVEVGDLVLNTEDVAVIGGCVSCCTLGHELLAIVLLLETSDMRILCRVAEIEPVGR